MGGHRAINWLPPASGVAREEQEAAATVVFAVPAKLGRASCGAADGPAHDGTHADGCLRAKGGEAAPCSSARAVGKLGVPPDTNHVSDMRGIKAPGLALPCTLSAQPARQHPRTWLLPQTRKRRAVGCSLRRMLPLCSALSGVGRVGA